MPRQFGVISTNGSLSASLLQTASKGTTAEVAEAQNEFGKRTDMIAFSKTKTAASSFVLDTGDTVPEAGSIVTIGGVTGICMDSNIEEINTGYTSGNMSVETKDSAALVDYASSGGLSS